MAALANGDRLVVQVHMTGSPRDLVDTDPESAGWTDLSDRVRSYSSDRGRQDRTSEFEPGTITVTFDNSDQQLDPMKVGSLVELAADKGLPLSPVRAFGQRADDSFYPLFYGYLSPECWVVKRTRQAESVSEIQAIDRMGWFAQVELPRSPFAAALAYSAPDFWVRGLGGGVISGNGGVLRDSSGNGYAASIYAPGSNVMFETDSLIDSDDDSAMRLMTGVYGRTSEAALTAAAADVSMCCVWKGTAAAGDQNVIRQQRFLSHVRWRVQCTTAGQMVLTIYNTSGSATSFIAAPSNLASGSGGRWDDGEPHLVFVRITGGGSMRIWVDGRTNTVASGIPATVDGLVIFGGGPQTADFDEVAYWNRVVSLGEMSDMGGAWNGSGWPWSGDTLSERVFRWLDVAGVAYGAADEAAMPAAPLGEPVLGGVDEVPSSLAAAIRAAAGSYRGETYVDRSGFVRARSLLLYTQEAAENTPLANLTDQPSPAGSPPPVRRSQPEWSGVRIDRVTNLSRVTWGGLSFSIRNDASIARYGERVRSWTSGLATALEAVAIAVDDVEANGVPALELRAVTVEPLLDPNAATLVIEDLELEQLVRLTWTPHGGSATALDCRIQGEQWEWAAGKWTVQLALAPVSEPIEVAPSEPQETFRYTGDVQEWVVPTGVTTIQVDAYGAQGGYSLGNVESGGPGAFGGWLSATVSVTPGETLEVYVGERPEGTAGGWNGGGAGAGLTSPNLVSGAGGGASDVRRSPYALADRLVVAGAGGGAGGNDTLANTGGLGGYADGGTGTISTTGHGGGVGGSASAGGAAGTSGTLAVIGSAGALGVGGSAGSADRAGGGGGAGLYGGGAGAGSAAMGRNGGGGGGGSSGTTGTVLDDESGVNEGDGYVVIRWEEP